MLAILGTCQTYYFLDHSQNLKQSIIDIVIHFIKISINNVCTSGESANQCSDTNVACLVESGFTYKCLCSSTFYQNNVGNCASSK